MEENIYMLPDGEIRRRIGQKIRRLQLRQNFTQASLAEQAQVFLRPHYRSVFMLATHGKGM